MHRVLSKEIRLKIILQKIWNWCWLIRITILIPIIFTCLCAAAFFNISPTERELLFMIASLVLLASGGYIINDISDKSKDSINHPNRPLPSGKIDISNAKIVGSVIIIMSLFLSTLTYNHIVVIMIIFSALIIIGYSWIIERKAWLKNILTSALSLLPWLLPAALTNRFEIIMIPASITFLLVLSREILLDIHDIDGDKFYNHKTIPVILGRKKASLISLLLLGIVFVSIVLLSTTGTYSYNLLLIAGTCIGLTGLLIAWILITGKKGIWLDVGCHLGKAQFIFGIVAWWIEAPL